MVSEPCLTTRTPADEHGQGRSRHGEDEAEHPQPEHGQGWPARAKGPGNTARMPVASITR